MNPISPAAIAAAQRGPLFVVCNKSSGSQDALAEQQTMAAEFESAGRAYEFFNVENPAQLLDVAGQALARAQKENGVVVAAGGDGTINAVAGVVLASGCPFGVLPQGTFNYFGRVHGIPQGTQEAARALVGASLQPVQAGLVNGRIFLVNASLGLYPQLLEDREAWKSQLGRSRVVAFASGIATLLKSRHQLRLEIEQEGQAPRSLRTPTLFVGNNQLQLNRVGIEPGQADAVNEGLLTAITVRPIGTLALFNLLLHGVLGRLGDAENIDSFTLRRLTVSPKGQRRIKVATDGEVVVMRTPLVFKVAEQPLLLMVPAISDRAEVA